MTIIYLSLLNIYKGKYKKILFKYKKFLFLHNLTIPLKAKRKTLHYLFSAHGM